MICSSQGLSSSPTFASLGPAQAMFSLQQQDLSSYCAAEKLKEVCILMRKDTELMTEAVGLVHHSGKRRGFEPWQHTKSCLRQGAPLCCGKPLRGDGPPVAQMV